MSAHEPERGVLSDEEWNEITCTFKNGLGANYGRYMDAHERALVRADRAALRALAVRAGEALKRGLLADDEATVEWLASSQQMREALAALVEAGLMPKET